MSIEQVLYEIELSNCNEKDFVVKLEKSPGGSFFQVCINRLETINPVSTELFERYIDAQECFCTRVKEYLIRGWDIPSRGHETVVEMFINYAGVELIRSSTGYRLHRDQT